MSSKPENVKPMQSDGASRLVLDQKGLDAAPRPQAAAAASYSLQAGAPMSRQRRDP